MKSLILAVIVSIASLNAFAEAEVKKLKKFAMMRLKMVKQAKYVKPSKFIRNLKVQIFLRRKNKWQQQ